MAVIKRLNYFRHQFLREGDFIDEQNYHIEMRRLHNRYMHDWGIVDGLLVQPAVDGAVGIVVTEGIAIDTEGKELVSPVTAAYDLAAFAPGSVYVTIEYEEQGAPPQPGDEATGTSTRTIERAAIKLHPHNPALTGLVIPLAIVHIDHHLHVVIDESVRKMAGLRGLIHTQQLADECVTPSKLAYGLRRQHGWVRMAFKPHPEPRRDDPELDHPRFRIGPTEAVAWEVGAVGSMGIPAPPGALRVTGFRIAGRLNKGGLAVWLYKCGWNPDKQKHEKVGLLGKDDTIAGSGEHLAAGPNPFERAWDLDEKLDRGHHALAVRVEAGKVQSQGRVEAASISLIAVRFEYELRDYEMRRLVNY